MKTILFCRELKNRMGACALALLLPITFAAPISAHADGHQPTFYVDPAKGSDTNTGLSPEVPLKALEQAKKAVREALKKTSDDVTVLLRGGVYNLTQTLSLDDRDAGNGNRTVRYLAYKDEKPIIMGGKAVTGWSLHDPDKNIYKANIGPIETRQLFVNGNRATRARSNKELPNGNLADLGLTAATVEAEGHSTSDIFISGWKNPSDLEFVYEQIWTKPRCGVDNITSNGTVAHVIMKEPGWKWCRNKGITSVTTPVYYENAYELLDQPGEWYLDRTGVVDGNTHTFYYIPRKGEDLSTAEVIAPTLEQLVTVKGRSVDTPAKNITFSGLTFAYTTWLRPNGPGGHPDAQNNIIREDKQGSNYREFIPDGAALTLKHAQNVSIERCKFKHLGGAGINAYAGVQNSLIRGCSFIDISGTGIQLGDYLGCLDPASENYCFLTDPDRKDLDHRLTLCENSVSNNYFNGCGVDFPSATAIAAAFPIHSTFSHNEIENLPYSGIHIGWGWVRVPKSDLGGNRVEFNKVTNVMRDLNDGGCIYFLGRQSGPEALSFVHGNYVSGCSNQGLYFDEGSNYFKASDNVCEAIGDEIVKIAGTDKHDIEIKTTYATKQLPQYKSPRITADPAILATPGNWPSAAEKIMSEAGLEPAYSDISPQAKK